MDQAQNLRNIIKMNKPVLIPNTNCRIIAVTSGKGGVGKSNVSVNLAIQLKKQGKRVLIFDADFGLANVEVMFGAIPKYNLNDVIYNGMSIREIVSYGPYQIPFVSGGSGILGLSNITRDQIALLLRNMAELDSLADVIIIDTGAGIADNVMEFVSASSEVILVTTPEPSSLTDSYSLLKVLSSRPGFNKDSTKIKVIANKAATREDGKNIYSKLLAVVNQFLSINIELLGIIPQDPALEKAVMQQVPVSLQSPDAKSSQSFAEIATSLIRNESYADKQTSGMAKMFARLFNRF